MAPQHGLCPLNEGRGINPGDTACSVVSVTPCVLRSTKAGASTPATRASHAAAPSKADFTAQRRPGHQPRRHGAPRPRHRSRYTPLNEGRGINPGDTFTAKNIVRRSRAAQRRPGHQPRRHMAKRKKKRYVLIDRSTKAGASTPATPPALKAVELLQSNAQRRPGHQPRRHEQNRPVRRGPRLRSTKAGASTPATPTVRARRNTCTARRSTKAGASTPATPVPIQLRPSAHAVAQRRPGHQPRRHRARGRSWALR